jgi:putative spermidine/putrescine transport system substrate-binding protein
VKGAEVEADEVNQLFSPTAPENIDSTNVIDMKWWGANVDTVDQAWTAWQAG